MRSFKGQGHS